MPKDEFGDPERYSFGVALGLVFLDWDRYAVIANENKVLASHNLNLIHLFGVHRMLVNCIDQNLVENFYQPR